MRLCFQKWKRGCGPVVDTPIPQGQGRGFKSLPQKQNKTANQITKTNNKHKQQEAYRSLDVQLSAILTYLLAQDLQGNFSSHGDLGTSSFICGVLFVWTLQFGVKRVGQKGERGILLFHNAGLCPIGKKTSFSIWVWHVSCPHPFQVHVMCLNNWSRAGCSVLWGCETIRR